MADASGQESHFESWMTLNDGICDAIDALKTLDKQEPVGQLLEDAFGRGQVMWFNKPKDESMLYTTPPQRKPMTYEEIEDLYFKFSMGELKDLPETLKPHTELSSKT